MIKLNREGYPVGTRYKINTARVNCYGLRWEYRGKTDHWELWVKTFGEWHGEKGIRVTDTVTNEVVYQKMYEEVTK